MRLRTICLMVLGAICVKLSSCHSHPGNESASEVAEPGTLKVIVYKKPPGLSYKDKVGFKRNLANNLGLPVLTGGYRGMHLRVWAWDSTKTIWVIDITRNSRGSRCTVLSYTWKAKDTITYIYIHQQRDVQPKSDWVNFFNELKKLHIPEMEKRTLPEDRESSFTSMTYVQFEIDGPNEYRYIEYPDPLFFRNEDETSKTIDEFFRYFNKEMGTAIYDAGKYANGEG